MKRGILVLAILLLSIIPALAQEVTPQWATIHTASKSIVVNNAGNLGDQGDISHGWNSLAFFNDCDTANNIHGKNNNARIYLDDASPYLLRVIGNDTVMNSFFANARWFDENGFLATQSMTIDSTTHEDYRSVFTGKFVTYDSAIALENFFYAPNSADSSDFIILTTKIYNNTGSDIDRIFAGDLIDWDIPSDSGVENGSGFDATRQMMYMFGAEYGDDTSQAYGPYNNCIASNLRMGSLTYYNGYHATGALKAAISSPKCMFTGTNANWIHATGNFVPSQLYKKVWGLNGYESWSSSNPGMEDSLYQDLTMVSCYGFFNLPVGDTLVFVKILSTTEDAGLPGIYAAIDKGKQWISNRRSVFPAISCCDVAGDVNNNSVHNLLDITFLINYLYRAGSRPPCMEQADCNADCKVNLLDVTNGIFALFKCSSELPSPNCGWLCKCPVGCEYTQ